MTVTVQPTTPNFAAEVGDVDLARPLGADDLAAIRAAFTKYAVLVFPDQTFTDDSQLDFARNFGPLKNTYNGVMATTGDAVLLFLPADLQDPPDLLPEFVAQWEAGYEIVYGIRAEREEGMVIKAARRGYYRLLSRLTYVNYPPDEIGRAHV